VYVGSGAGDVDVDADALDALGVDSDALGLDLDALGVVGSVPAALEEWGVSDVDLEGPVLQGFAAVASLPRLKSNLRMVLPVK